MKIYTTGRTVAPHNSKKKKKQKRSLQLSERPSSAEYIFLFFVIFIALIGSMSVILRANEMFCSLRSFHKEPCASSASCCLRGCCLFGYCFTNKRFKTMGKRVFSDLWLQKPLYKEWLREVKGDKHKARYIVLTLIIIIIKVFIENTLNNRRV